MVPVWSSSYEGCMGNTDNFLCHITPFIGCLICYTRKSLLTRLQIIIMYLDWALFVGKQIHLGHQHVQHLHRLLSSTLGLE